MAGCGADALLVLNSSNMQSTINPFADTNTVGTSQVDCALLGGVDCTLWEHLTNGSFDGVCGSSGGGSLV